ncbi:DUF1501 domain-containing protein [Occallatibacter savannae]|uniref:DUF1501 domain-containing protein n=1 Tax=Occallatibacter savannae TaxID=1002691 RepID=UPI000D69CBA4|nr:DUF1501 domain-containing protein [Occallatibacter savannae]
MIHQPAANPITRREALRRMGCGFGYLSLASLVGESLARAESTLDRPSWMITDKPKAKHVIFLFMNGGLSQVDSFDPKPMLEKYHGQPMPGGDLQHERKTGNLMKSPFTFKKYGQSGIEVSEIFPHLAECVDDMCFVRSVYTEIPNHEPALLMMNTGANFAGRPSMGSWLTYGLGSTNKNLPGFVVLCPDTPTTVGPPLWSSAFLSPVYQGTYVSDAVEKSNFDPLKLIPNIHNDRFDLKQQQKEIDLVKQLDQMNIKSTPGGAHDLQLEATIGAMETAFRMQTEAPDVFDVRKESDAVIKMYGEGSTARGCLTAARLIERGVRMVQIYYAKGDPWDHHFDIQEHRKTGRDSDQPFAALIKDLKARGLFDETIIVAGSEFGRTPVVEIGSAFMGGQTHNGRDHNPHGFTMWLAGGGFKRGFAYGATDDFGWKAIENPVHVHDIHATILYQLGIDHTKLTYHYSGRDFRLTDLAGNVIHDLIA